MVDIRILLSFVIFLHNQTLTKLGTFRPKHVVLHRNTAIVYCQIVYCNCLLQRTESRIYETVDSPLVSFHNRGRLLNQNRLLKGSFPLFHRSVSWCFKVFHCPVSSCFMTMKQLQWERALIQFSDKIRRVFDERQYFDWCLFV